MPVTARLEVGWPRGRRPEACALDKEALREAAGAASTPEEAREAYAAALHRALGGRRTVYALDALMRRTGPGLLDFKRFLAVLAEHDEGSFVCHMDAFAYAFAKGAMNIDFVMPIDREDPGDYFRERASLTRKIAAIERLEWYGREGDLEPELKRRYLHLRKVTIRPSARDERLALATLLWSGPCTRDEIYRELGLGESLAARALHPFEESGVIAREEDRLRIAEESLPMVLFVLRETLGVDPIGALGDG